MHAGIVLKESSVRCVEGHMFVCRVISGLIGGSFSETLYINRAACHFNQNVDDHILPY